MGSHDGTYSKLVNKHYLLNNHVQICIWEKFWMIRCYFRSLGNFHCVHYASVFLRVYAVFQMITVWADDITTKRNVQFSSQDSEVISGMKTQTYNAVTDTVGIVWKQRRWAGLYINNETYNYKTREVSRGETYFITYGEHKCSSVLKTIN
jgi:hypothetical protein